MQIQTINAKNFRRYGRVIEYPKKETKGNKRNLFRIVLTEPKPNGWRIAYLIVRDKKISRLEQHPHSFESFEPVKGKAILYIALKTDPAAIKCFYLDCPVILHKKVWHGVVTLTDETEIKLTENAHVQCVFWKMDCPLTQAGLPPKQN